MGSTVFPSLSSDGFVEDRSILSKKLFEMFLASDRSQSNFKDAQSLKYILNTETIDDYEKNEAIRKSLDTLFTPYFDDLIISVGNDTDDDSVTYFNIKIDAVYNGNTYSINESISNKYYVDIDKFDNELEQVIK